MEKVAIFTVGCSASGKSTWAQNILRKYTGTKIISRDDFRRRLLGIAENENLWTKWEFSRENENKITEMYISHLNLLVLLDTPVIILEDTNLDILSSRHTEKVLLLSDNGYRVKYAFMTLDKNTLIARDKNRIQSVGRDIILKQLPRWNKIFYSVLGDKKYPLVWDDAIYS